MHDVERQVSRDWPPRQWSDVTVLAAVSGGADSVALLRCLAALREGAGEGRLVAAHFNHGLRGPESDGDEAFVVELCRELGIPCATGRAAVLPDDDACGATGMSEAAARDRRYEFLRETAAQWGARYVAAGHTADDQAETILHRIVRGTGLSGLSGMARFRRLGPATLVRPLLAVRRVELLEYLDALEQPYRRDRTNDDPRYTRNRLRHTLLPLLTEQFNPGAVDALLRLGRLADEVNRVVEAMVEEECERRVTVDGPDAVTIEAEGLADRPRYLLRQVLRAAWNARAWPAGAMGLRQWDQLAAMLAAADRPPGQGAAPRRLLRKSFPGHVSAESQPGMLRLQRDRTPR